MGGIAGGHITVLGHFSIWASLLRVPAPSGSTPERAGGRAGQEADHPCLRGAQACCVESTCFGGNVIKVRPYIEPFSKEFPGKTCCCMSENLQRGP